MHYIFVYCFKIVYLCTLDAMYNANLTNMEYSSQLVNSVLIQGATLADIERMINRAVDARMQAFYESIKEKPLVMIKRKEAAKMLGVSLPTLDQYGKFGILHPQHLGGRVYYDEAEIEKYKQTKK